MVKRRSYFQVAAGHHHSVGAEGNSYNPNLPALFSRNKLPSRIYRRTICMLRCPVWFMIERSDAPAIAALVACPARSECPAYFPESSPSRCASFLTTGATSIPDNRIGCTCPCRFNDRNSGPLLIAAASIHA